MLLTRFFAFILTNAFAAFAIDIIIDVRQLRLSHVSSGSLDVVYQSTCTVLLFDKNKLTTKISNNQDSRKKTSTYQYQSIIKQPRIEE